MLLNELIIFVIEASAGGAVWDKMKGIFGKKERLLLERDNKFDKNIVILDSLEDKSNALKLIELYDEYKNTKSLPSDPTESYISWLEIRSEHIIYRLNSLEIDELDKKRMIRQFRKLHKKHVTALKNNDLVLAYQHMLGIIRFSNDSISTSKNNTIDFLMYSHVSAIKKDKKSVAGLYFENLDYVKDWSWNADDNQVINCFYQEQILIR